MFCSKNIEIVVCTTVSPKPDIFIKTGLKAKTTICTMTERTNVVTLTTTYCVRSLSTTNGIEQMAEKGKSYTRKD